MSATFTEMSTLDKPSALDGVKLYVPFNVIVCALLSSVYGSTITLESP